MVWAKVDDGWWCHPKVLGLDLAARGLWVSALSWSCAQRRSVVPLALVSMLGGSEAEAKQLEASGLWDSVPDGWEIHDWNEYQQQSTSEKKAEAGRKGGRASGEARRSKGQASVEAGPVPSRPDLGKPSSSQSDSLPDAGVGDEDEIRRIVMDLRAKGSNPPVTNRAGWERAFLRNAKTDGTDDAIRDAIARYDEPAHVLAEVVVGKRSGQTLRFLKRREAS